MYVDGKVGMSRKEARDVRSLFMLASKRQSQRPRVVKHLSFPTRNLFEQERQSMPIAENDRASIIVILVDFSFAKLFSIKGKLRLDVWR